MKQQPFWSIVIPVFNEARRIDHLTEVLAYLADLKASWELLVVDDGSTDGTGKLLEKLNQKNLFRIISYPKNQGKGYAVKEGMLAATGKYRLFLDVDLSTPISEMTKLTPLLGKSDVIIGTRKAKGANVIIHQPWLREHLGKGFTFLSQVVLGVNVSDFTCGFKCFTETSALKVFGNCHIYRWGFDSEILFLSRKYGFSITEVPVTWRNDINSRVRFPGDLISSLSELFRIRYNDLILGLYR